MELMKHVELAGTLLEAGETLRAGRFAAAAGDWRAKMMERAATQEVAAASRDVAEVRRQGRLAQSTLQANAAASGGGPAPEIAGQLEAETEYSALSALYEGQERARALRTNAEASRLAGRRARGRARLRAGGGLIEAAPSLFEKYADELPEWMRGAAS